MLLKIERMRCVPAAVATSAAVGNDLAALAVNLGAAGFGKSKRGRAEPHEFVVILVVCVIVKQFKLFVMM